MADITGTHNADVIEGTANADLIMAGCGDDTIYGLGAGDTVDAGDGNDTLRYTFTDEAGVASIDMGAGNDYVHISPALAQSVGSALGGTGNDTLRIEIEDITNNHASLDMADFATFSGFEQILVFVNNSLLDVTGTDNAENMVIGVSPVAYGVDDDFSWQLTPSVIDAGGGDDHIAVGGQHSIFTVSGGTGNDTIEALNGPFGALGQSFLNADGGSGNDVLIGQTRDDTLTGGSGNDTLTGGSGADIFFFGAGWGNDSLMDYADGTDQIDMSATGLTFDDLTITQDLADTVIEDGSGNSIRLANVTASDITAEDLNLPGGSGSSGIITGTSGNDTLAGTLNSDTIHGLGGNDTIYATTGGDVIDGGAGTDVLDLMSELASQLGQDVAINAEIDGAATAAGQTIVSDMASIEVLKGGECNDTLWGNLNDDGLIGGDGDDLLYGRAGNDTLVGGNGDDTLDGDIRHFPSETGNDVLTGGAGADTFSYVIAGFGNDTITDFEHGTDQIDMAGNGLSFSDLTITQQGSDALISDGSGNTILLKNITAASITAEDLNLGAGVVWGTAGDDTLVGTANADTVSGLAGDDTIYATTGGDIIIGGEGIDLLDLMTVLRDQLGGDVAVNAAIDGPVTAEGQEIISDMASIEILRGGACNDTLWGAHNNDTLYGMGGNDRIDGRGGNDYLSGGDGNDVIYGISGTDTIDGGAGDDQIEVGGNPALVMGGSGNDTIHAGTGNTTIDGGDGQDRIDASGGQNVISGGNDSDTISGGTGADTLSGGGGDDFLEGREGDDLMTGGAGADTYSYGAGWGNDTITDFDLTSDQINLSHTGMTFEDVTITQDGADALISDGSGNSIRLLGINADDVTPDLLTLESGIYGTNNNDTLIGTANDDIINGLDGDDQINGGFGNDLLIGGDGNDVLTGYEGNDTLLGGNGDDTLKYTVNVADYTNPGADVFDGGDGTDLLVVGSEVPGLTWDLGSWNIENIDISGAAGEGYSTQNLIYGGDAANSILSRYGTDTVRGGNGDDTITGWAESKQFDGEDGDDVLTGGIDADTLTGGAGDDLLSGGQASDSFVFGAGWGNDTITDFEHGTDQIDMSGTGLTFRDLTITQDGTDALVSDGSGNSIRLQNVTASNLTASDLNLPAGQANVTLQGTSAGDSLTGGIGNDSLSGGDGNDTLSGGCGDDTLIGGNGDDMLIGGDGADAIVGGAGDDTVSYAGSSAGVNVSLTAGGTIRLIELFPSESGIDIDVGSAQENPSLFDAAAGGGSGGAAAGDTIAGVENIIGSAFDDTLAGDAENNRFTGGSGSDTYILVGGWGQDTITDFTIGEDIINLSAAGVSFGDLSISQQGDDALVEDTNGNSLLLLGVDASALGASSFNDDRDDDHYQDIRDITYFAPTGDLTLDGLLMGRRYTDDTVGDQITLTYSFPDSTSQFDGIPSYGAFGENTYNLREVAASTVALFETTFAWLEGVTNLNFLEVEDSGDSAGTIRAAWTSYSRPGVAAWAYYPATGVYAGDIWFSSLTQSETSNYFKLVYIHELGHALGLKHPHDTFGSFGRLDSSLDGWDYTVMSYRASGRNPEATGGDLYPQTFMQLDIKALQYLYGVDYNSTSGDNSYLFDLSDRHYLTIYDSGGIDTFGVTGGDANVHINLTPGSWSDIGTVISYTGLNSPEEHETVYVMDDVIIENAVGANGDDTLTGNSADNRLEGNAGNDLLEGGLGNDTLVGGSGADIYRFRGSWGDDTITGYTDGEDRLDLSQTGLSFDDLAISQQGSDVLISDGSGNSILLRDTNASDISAADLSLDGNSDSIVIVGTTGDDSLSGTAGSDSISGQAGADTIRGNNGDDTLSGGADDDLIFGGAGNDMIFGLDGKDTLYGDAGDDTITGGAESDTIDGGDGNDRIDAGGGHDRIRGSRGADTIDGGSDGDGIIDYRGSDAGVSVNLTTGENHFGYAEGDVLSNIDYVLGSHCNDTLVGSGDRDYLSAQGGNDLVSAGDGNDVIWGGDGNDTLFGGDGRDDLIGMDGNDYLIGGNGDDYLRAHDGADTIDGGNGRDNVNYSSSGAAILVNLETGATAGGEAEGDVLISVEDIYASQYDDTITGDSNDNSLTGLGGSDILSGGCGDDSLDGGAGADLFRFDAGWGHDTIADFDGNTDQIDMSSTGLAFADLIITQNGADALISDGAGNSIRLSDTPIADLTPSTLNIPESNMSNSDVIYGTTSDDSLVGGANNDTIVGFGGNDQLTGGGGADTFVFGPGWGNDTITDFDPATDRVDMSTTGLTFAGLSIEETGDGTLVSDDDGNSILFANVARGSLNPALLGIEEGNYLPIFFNNDTPWQDYPDVGAPPNQESLTSTISVDGDFNVDAGEAYYMASDSVYSTWLIRGADTSHVDGTIWMEMSSYFSPLALDTTTLINTGDIITLGMSGTTGGVRARDLDNSGSIIAAAEGRVTGVLSSDISVFENSGLIHAWSGEGSATGATITYGWDNPDDDTDHIATNTGTILADGYFGSLGIGINFSTYLENGVLVNEGLIQATSSGIGGTSTGISFYTHSHDHSDPFTLVNSGIVRADTAIANKTTALTITNSGTLDGDLLLSWHNEAINNTGSITGLINFGSGDDSLNSATGSLGGPIYAGDGDDTIIAAAGDDRILAGTGADIVDGGLGRDSLSGGDGNDTLDGGQGADLIDAGRGDDRITTGDGNDTVVFGAGWGQDTIEDYTDGTDMLDLSATGLTFNQLTIETIGSDTRISAGTANTITLRNVNAADISANDLNIAAGTSGTNSISGTASSDTLTGTATDDHISTGDGNDVILFADGWGNDTLTDFDATADILDFVSTDLGFADLTIQQVGNNVVIEAPSGDTITLLDASASDLDEGNLRFGKVIDSIADTTFGLTEAETYVIENDFVGQLDIDDVSNLLIRPGGTLTWNSAGGIYQAINFDNRGTVYEEQVINYGTITLSHVASAMNWVVLENHGTIDVDLSTSYTDSPQTAFNDLEDGTTNTGTINVRYEGGSNAGGVTVWSSYTFHSFDDTLYSFSNSGTIHLTFDATDTEAKITAVGNYQDNTGFLNSGTIEGVESGDGNTLYAVWSYGSENAGLIDISSTGTNAVVGGISARTSTTTVNTGDILISASAESSVAIGATLTWGVTFDNAGSIDVSSAGQAIGVSIYKPQYGGGEAVTFTNSGDLTVSGGDAVAIKVDDDARVVNTASGAIVSDGYGIVVTAGANHFYTSISNAGTITAVNSAYFYESGRSGDIVNSGTMTSTGDNGDGTISFTASATGSSSHSITNEAGGVIEATGTNTAAIHIGGLSNAGANPYGNYQDHASVTNAGTIRSTGDAIIGGEGSESISNSGTIEGDIRLGEGGDGVTNTGHIEGNVYLGDGGDRFTVAAGGTVSGIIDGGNGDLDRIVIYAKDQSDDLAIDDTNYIGFEVLSGTGNGSMTVSGSFDLHEFSFSWWYSNDGRPTTGQLHLDGATISAETIEVSEKAVFTISADSSLTLAEDTVSRAKALWMGTDSTITNDGTITVFGLDNIVVGQGSDFTNNGALNLADGSLMGATWGDYGIHVVNNGSITSNATSFIGGAHADYFDTSAGQVTGAIEGGEGDDTLIGSANDDTLSGDEGDDLLTGGTGADLLQFAVGWGNDTIEDFDGATDTIDMSATDAYFANLEITQEGDDALISDGNGNSILIRNFSAASIDAALLNIPEQAPAQVITGTAGDDHYQGGAGDDTLIATTGTDTIDGGAGFDILDFSGLDFPIYATIGEQAFHLYGGHYGLFLIPEMTGIEGLRGTHNSDDLEGTPGADLLAGNGGNDFLDGKAGDDTLEGDGGHDYLAGDAGDDRLDGGDGNDDLAGGSGNDQLTGGAGHDIFHLSNGWGQDTITDFDPTVDRIDITYTDLILSELTVTQQGSNTLIEDGNGNQLLLLNTNASDISEANVIWNGRGYISGTWDSDWIDGGSGAEFVRGFEGNDTIDAGGGNDTISGGPGDDTFIINLTSGNDVITDFAAGDAIVYQDARDYSISQQGDDVRIILSQNGSSSSLIVQNASVADVEARLSAFEWEALTLVGTNGDDGLYGSAGNDTIDARGGNDYLIAGAGEDILDGGDGHDTLSGGSGNDDLVGGGGNDRIVDSRGHDTIDGGTGDDSIRAGAGDDVITTGEGNDWVDAGDNNDFIYTGLGSDTINGGAGDDTVDLAVAGAAISLDLTAGTATVGANTLILTNIDSALGSNAGNDLLKGSETDNGLSGRAGDDTLEGRGGDDVLTGGSGSDTFVYSGSAWGNDTIEDFTSGVDVLDMSSTLTTAGDVAFTKVGDSTLLEDGNGNSILIRGIVPDDINLDDFRFSRIINGSNGDDSLVGDSQDNSMWGGCGDDMMSAGAGADSVVGGDGDDTLDGGTGNDTLEGGAGADLMIGGAGADLVMGGCGDDTVQAIFIEDGGAAMRLEALTQGSGRASGDIVLDDTGAPQVTVSEDGLTYTYEGGRHREGLAVTEEIDSGQHYWEITLSDVPRGGGHLYVAIAAPADSDWSDVLGTIDGSLMLRGNGQTYVGDGRRARGGVRGLDRIGEGDVIGVAFNADAGAIWISINGEWQNGATAAEIAAGDTSHAVMTGIDVPYVATAGGYSTSNRAGHTATFAFDTNSFSYAAPEGYNAYGSSANVVGDPGDTLDGGDGIDWIDLSNAPEGILMGDGRLEATGDSTIAGDIYRNFENIRGSACGDQLNGGDGNNVILGEDGNDTLSGGNGDDTLVGGDGDDTLIGDSGNDDLVGGDGDDLLLADGIGDTLQGGAGEDTLSFELAAEGVDHPLFPGDGIEVLIGSSHNDILYGGGIDAKIKGGAGNDTLYGISGDDTLEGGDDNDQIDGGKGNDIAYGGNGDDAISGAHNDDTLFGEDGDDILFDDRGTNVLDGGDGIDTYLAFGNDDVINLATGVATSSGGANSLTNIETVRAGTGNDTITGDDGANVLMGEGGDDRLAGGCGDDTLVGGTGADTFVFEADFVSDHISDFTSGEDVIDLSRMPVTFGSLVINQDGSDTIVEVPDHGEITLVGVTASALTADDFYFGETTLDGTAGDDLIEGLFRDETLSGFAGDDTLRGGDGLDLLLGGAGNDLLDGGAGADIIMGGCGDDTVQAFAGATGTEKALEDASHAGQVTVSGDLTYTYEGGRNREGVALSEDIDSGQYYWEITLTDVSRGGGNLYVAIAAPADSDWSDVLGSIDGSLMLRGNGQTSEGDGRRAGRGVRGLDSVGEGDVIGVAFDADAGAIWISINGEWQNGATAAEIAAGDTSHAIITGIDEPYVPTAGGYSTSNRAGHTATFSVDADSFSYAAPDGFNAYASVGAPEGGFDTVDGGDGIDVIDFSGLTSGVDMTGVSLSDTGGALIGGDLYQNFENIIGSCQDDLLNGGDGNNDLSGGAGDDTLIGGAGDDTLTGGAGADLFRLTAGFGTAVITDFTSGTDKVDLQGSGYDYWDIVDGLTDVGGIATFDDGNGNVLTFAGLAAGTITVDDFLFGGSILLGTHGEDTLTGTSDADYMIGLDSDDSLYGDAGNDTLLGSNGDDTLDGGEGFDHVSLTDGNDRVNLETGVAQMGTAGDGTDTLINIEAAHGGCGDDTLIGSDADELLTGDAGDDVIMGAGGDDTLSGGSGADSFVLSDGWGGDVITDFTPGSDILDFSVSSLSFGDLTISDVDGDAVISDTNGNSITLVGVSAASIGESTFSFGDTLTGTAGNDSLVGSLGRDSIVGLAGDDTILGGDSFDTILGGAGNDLIEGGAGADLISGGCGDDTITAYGGEEASSGTGLEDASHASQVTVTDDLSYTYEGGRNREGVAATDEMASGQHYWEITLTDVARAGSGLFVAIAAPAGSDWTQTLGTIDGSLMLRGNGQTYVGDGRRASRDERGLDSVDEGDVIGVAFDADAGAIWISINGEWQNGATAEEIAAGDTSHAIMTGITEPYVPTAGGYDTSGRGGHSATFAFSSEDFTYAAPTGFSPYGGEPMGFDTVDGGDGFDVIDFTDLGTGVDMTGVSLSDTDGLIIAGDRYENFEGVRGSCHDDLLNGGAGANMLSGGCGDDTLDGGTGDDTLSGGMGADLFSFASGFGSDVITDFDTATDLLDLRGAGFNFAQVLAGLTQDGADAVFDAGDGNILRLTGVTASEVTVANFAIEGTVRLGTAAGDIIGGDSGDDYAIGLAGNDSVTTGGGSDTLDGGAGNDTLNAGSGDDTLTGGLGHDDLIGGSGSDRFIMRKAEGNDTITDFDVDDDILDLSATDITADTLLGRNAEETTSGGVAGVLIVEDWGGTLFIEGLTLAELMDATILYSGETEVPASSAGQRIRASNRSDTVTGTDGDDLIDARRGDDTIDGGLGDDTITGNRHDDRFVLSADSGNDVITDLDLEDDTLDLSGTAAGFTSLSDVLEAAYETSHGRDDGVLIDLGGGNSVFLEDISLAELTRATIIGDGGAVLDVAASDDTFRGTSGADVFTFAGNHGNDVITGFDPANDTLDLTGIITPIDSITLDARETVLGRDHGVLIDTGGGNTVFIAGVTLGQMAFADVDV